jgi:hypothetical protein
LQQAIVAGTLTIPRGALATADEPRLPAAPPAVLVAPPGSAAAIAVDRGALQAVWAWILIGGFLIFFLGTSLARFWIGRR